LFDIVPTLIYHTKASRSKSGSHHQAASYSEEIVFALNNHVLFYRTCQIPPQNKATSYSSLVVRHIRQGLQNFEITKIQKVVLQ